MGLGANLVVAFLPRARSPDAAPYRALVRETADYMYDIGDYRPYRGGHEPPDRTARPERAEIVFRRIVALEAERTAEIGRLLAREGVAVAPTREAWNGIGDWIGQAIEGSREPGSDRYRPFVTSTGPLPPRSVHGESTSVWRPIFHSIVLDLSLLLGRHMIMARPEGNGHWGRSVPEECKADPEILFDGDPRFYAPFAFVPAEARGALLKRLGLVERTPSRLGEAIRRVQEPPELIEDTDPKEDVIVHLRAVLAAGETLRPADVGEILYEYGLDELPPLPGDLASRVPRP